jgi:Holliday junction DNA helicase RuvA
MIGYLRGLVLYRDEDVVVLECGGVGYEVFATREALNALPGPGDEGSCFIHTLVREDEISLYGFHSREERTLFELLNSVSGVGAKTAMLVLSGLSSGDLIQAVLSGNPLPFTRVKGIGKRTAERIILELKDKMGKVYASAVVSSPSTGPAGSRRAREAEQALVGLGFRPAEVAKVLAGLPNRESLSVEELIREGLAKLR